MEVGLAIFSTADTCKIVLKLFADDEDAVEAVVDAFFGDLARKDNPIVDVSARGAESQKLKLKFTHAVPGSFAQTSCLSNHEINLCLDAVKVRNLWCRAFAICLREYRSDGLYHRLPPYCSGKLFIVGTIGEGAGGAPRIEQISRIC